MPAGEAFTSRQRDDIERAIRIGEKQGQMRISVYVGSLDGDSRVEANRLHAALGDQAADTVLVAVDPAGRTLEIVTGAHLSHRLRDRECGLAAMAMTSSFSAGDLAGGIVDGVRTLAEHARAPQSLHIE